MTAPRTEYQRLEDQIDWFDHKSVFHQRWHRRLKVVSIGAAALVPLLSGLEGLQHVNQHYDNWIRYRATCENLRHEKYLYLARAARYQGLEDEEAFRLLAANVESVLAREGEAWLRLRRSLDEKQKAKSPQAPAD